jgi:transglutaminase-like putative cysteine protease
MPNVATRPPTTNTEIKSRRLLIRHTTRYTYDRPVARSENELRLRPIDDWKQRVINFRLQTSPAASVIEYEDVFGNWVSRFNIAEPFTELSITAESEVEVLDVDPFAFAKLPIKTSFPLVWMPWEQMMLAPYLASVELPHTQLREIYEYAMSFVRKNNFDLMETLFAINLSFFREYKYTPGMTRVTTSPFEVFQTRSGVCQDFANLFICMARMLGIPARYVCGYIYTGNNGQNRARSDASHAWVQLYIPQIGWKGFDPTNGILPDTNHVRVGYGRHYRDTAPTAGTLFSPAVEAMTVDVEVNEA